MDYTRYRRTTTLALLAAVVILILSGCGGGGSSKSDPAPTQVLPGYLNNCLVDGKLVRWTNMPIGIFFDTANPPENWGSTDKVMFQDAMTDWSNTTNGAISFTVLSQPSNPFINVKWVKDSPMGQPEAAGVAKFESVVIDNKLYFQRVDIELATTRIGGVPYTTADQKIIALHELGHALGLWGHSDSPADIMYGSGIINTRGISSGDSLTINALYQRTPDVTQSPVGRAPERKGPIVIIIPKSAD